MNAVLREHLSAGGVRHLAVATAATLTLGAAGEQLPLNLTRKFGRLLAESGALVLAQIHNDADIENLG